MSNILAKDRYILGSNTFGENLKFKVSDIYRLWYDNHLKKLNFLGFTGEDFISKQVFNNTNFKYGGKEVEFAYISPGDSISFVDGGRNTVKHFAKGNNTFIMGGSNQFVNKEQTSDNHQGGSIGTGDFFRVQYGITMDKIGNANQLDSVWYGNTKRENIPTLPTTTKLSFRDLQLGYLQDNTSFFISDLQQNTYKLTLYNLFKYIWDTTICGEIFFTDTKIIKNAILCLGEVQIQKSIYPILHSRVGNQDALTFSDILYSNQEYSKKEDELLLDHQHRLYEQNNTNSTRAFKIASFTGNNFTYKADASGTTRTRFYQEWDTTVNISGGNKTIEYTGISEDIAGTLPRQNAIMHIASDFKEINWDGFTQ